MPRVKLTEQKKYPYFITARLAPRDMNYGGHLGNDSLVSIIGTARVETLHTLGFSENDLGDGRTGIIMADLVVNYRSEGFLFDEVTVDTCIGELSHNGFRFFHRMRKGETIIALVETGMISFDYSARKIVPLPEAFQKKIDH